VSQKKNYTVTIQNPPVGGSGYTNLKRALHFVHLDRAEWVNSRTIKFVHLLHTQQCIDAEIKLARAHFACDDVMATLDQAQGLPLAGPAIRLFSKGGGEFKPRALARGKVRTVSVCES
jgi:hypothetical protein